MGLNYLHVEDVLVVEEYSPLRLCGIKVMPHSNFALISSNPSL